jgi:ubiquitin C-terminal hydrolase
MNIHPRIHNKSSLLCELTQASAFQIARRISELCSSFIPGQQEDPSEFLIVLLNHFIQCISSNDIISFSTYLSNPLHSIFGINVKSSTICTRCENQIIKQNYESIWSISVVSYYNLKDALTAFCSKENLTGDNALQCSQCHTKTAALQSLQLVNISPIVIIHLNRFIYDQKKKLTRKLKHLISYPEFLNFMPYIVSNNPSSEAQENHQSDEYIYILYAVVVHLGETADNGHIFVYVRSPDNLWYKINDESVTLVNPKVVLSDTNSYLLWYTKLSEEKRNLYRKEIDQLSKPSSHISFSSTPKRRTVEPTRSFDNYSPVRKKNFFF